MFDKYAHTAFRMEGLLISRDLKATRFAGANSTAQPAFCIRSRTARGQAPLDGQIAPMDTRRLSLVARRGKSNSTARKLTVSGSMRLTRCLKVVADLSSRAD